MKELSSVLDLPDNFKFVKPKYGVSKEGIERTTPPRTRFPVLGDGNCLFRSYSVFLTGSEEFYHQIRMLLCDYMLEKREFLAKYVGMIFLS